MSGRQPTAGFWITVAILAMVVLYPLSLGPACWISSQTGTGAHVVSLVYRPITWFVPTRRVIFRPNPLEAGMRRYSEFAAAPDWRWYSISSSPGQPQHWEWGQIIVY
jgi:hypothetical protein